MHSAVTTPTFERHAARAGLTDDEIIEMCVWLAENPQSGSLIAGTGGARKVRFSAPGRGKSGGYRTIHYYAGEDVPIFLLALIDKRERANLTKAERNELGKLLPQLADKYRAGVTANLRKLRRSK